MEAKLIKFFIFIEKYFPNNVTFVTYCEYLNTITGREIVNEFLMSTGYLPGAHSHEYPVYERIKQIKQTK